MFPILLMINCRLKEILSDCFLYSFLGGYGFTARTCKCKLIPLFLKKTCPSDEGRISSIVTTIITKIPPKSERKTRRFVFLSKM